ncbi:hypothetical protein SMC49_002107 [Cronobacter dublinensis]|nr:hypothetical protein [Cronobacter dublinensis]
MMSSYALMGSGGVAPPYTARCTANHHDPKLVNGKLNRQLRGHFTTKKLDIANKSGDLLKKMHRKI